MVDETAFHETRDALHEQPCPFKKAIFSTICGCAFAERLYVGDRELINCSMPAAHARCQDLLGRLREAARFTLQVTGGMDGGLPHDKQIRVETGGILGLEAQMHGTQPDPNACVPQLADINRLIDEAMARYGSLDAFPYSAIIRSVAGFAPRKRRRSRRARQSGD